MKRITRNVWSLIVVDIILFAHAFVLSHVGISDMFATSRRGASFAMVFGGMMTAACVLAVVLPVLGIYSIIVRQSEPFIGGMYAVILWFPGSIISGILVSMVDAQGDSGTILLTLTPYLVPAILLASIIWHLTRR